MAEPALKLVPTGLRCNKCGEVKALDEFWADNRKCARGRSQRNHYCRECLTASRPRHEILLDDDPRIAMGRRICSGCNKEKALADFGKSVLFKMGRETRCKACKNTWRAARKVPKRIPAADASPRDYRRRYTHGVSAATFLALYDAQDGKCGICSNEMDFLAKATCLDHSHNTGMIRGVLCQRCNLGIGHMKDDIKLMRSAIAYLEKHGES